MKGEGVNQDKKKPELKCQHKILVAWEEGKSFTIIFTARLCLGNLSLSQQ